MREVLALAVKEYCDNQGVEVKNTTEIVDRLSETVSASIPVLVYKVGKTK